MHNLKSPNLVLYNSVIFLDFYWAAYKILVFNPSVYKSSEENVMLKAGIFFINLCFGIFYLYINTCIYRVSTENYTEMKIFLRFSVCFDFAAFLAVECVSKFCVSLNIYIYLISYIETKFCA